VLIGACIPTLFPLVKKIFGASALGGNTPKNSGQKQSDANNNNTVVTIGSYPKNKKRPKGSALGLSQLDTVSDDSKYIILDERSFHTSTTELRGEEAVESQHQQQQQGQATSQPGW
jgi:hypothetical protein